MPFVAQQIRAARLHLQKSDPVMKRLLKVHGPFAARARSDRFASLVDSIVSQQISTSAARTIRSRLSDAVSQRAQQAKLTSPGMSAAALLLLNVDQLRQVGVSRQKANYLLDLADKVHSGAVDLQRISRLEDDQVIEQLIQVKGIGRWTAQMFLIFSLGRIDILPVDDLGVRSAVKNQYELNELPTANELEKIARPWRPYATVACWYLWRSLDADVK
ncbi:MAG: DNA-3-methyladenine glycosylase 2 family protein [Pirellulaceae bacterium]|nr:DNA-3-methyladenine glycosylase 2 family protein [Pirellulaceae bacterium]